MIIREKFDEHAQSKLIDHGGADAAGIAGCCEQLPGGERVIILIICIEWRCAALHCSSIMVAGRQRHRLRRSAPPRHRASSAGATPMTSSRSVSWPQLSLKRTMAADPGRRACCRCSKIPAAPPATACSAPPRQPRPPPRHVRSRRTGRPPFAKAC